MVICVGGVVGAVLPVAVPVREGVLKIRAPQDSGVDIRHTYSKASKAGQS